MPSPPDPADPQSQAPASQRRDRLLSAVAQASRALFLATDFRRDLQHALQLLGEAAGIHRVVMFLQRGVDGVSSVHEVFSEWCAPGIPNHADLGLTVLDDRTVPSFTVPLTAGRSVWATIDQFHDEIRPAFVRLQVKSTGCVPIFVGTAYAGAITFDDCKTARVWTPAEIDALTAAANVTGAALQRMRTEAAAVAAARAQATEQERLADLLRNVVASSRELIDAPDFEAGVLRWLANFGAATDAIRATLYDIGIHAASGLKTARMLGEWRRPGTTGSVSVTFAEPYEIDPRGAEDLMALMLSGEVVTFHADELAEPMSGFLRDQGNATVIAVPLFVDGRQWGSLSFDHAVKRPQDPRDLAVLQTAADTFSVILKRVEIQRQVLVEREARLAAERARAEDALELNHLLEGVVAASRALLEAADFSQGLQQWLAFLAQTVQADRAVYGELYAVEEKGAIARCLADWSAGGLASIANIEAPATVDFIDWVERLGRGEVVWADIHDLVDTESVRWWKSTDCAANLLVPVMIDGRNRGFLSFDWATPRSWRPAYGTVLRTAADGAAAAIRRNEAVQALMAERERSANERTAELAKANAGIRRTLSRLAASEDIGAFLATALLEVYRHSGGSEAYLFTLDTSGDGLMHMVGRVRGGTFHAGIEPGDPPEFLAGFMPASRAYAELLAHSGMIWREIDPQPISPHRTPGVQQWHLAHGHRAEARYLLQVGERTVGMVGIVFAHIDPVEHSRCELLVALSQPIALAMELSRLGRIAHGAAQERAVLAERNRMARDVHDTLAQGFTAISLQLQAAARAATADERDRFLARATQEAQDNLVESRRTIRLLRGMREADHETHGLMHLLEDALASRLAGSALHWRVVPADAASAALVPDTEQRRELKRIAQEAATNALKHAQATSFEATLVYRDGTLTLRLADDGKGFDPSARQEGFGLLGMRERAERIHAALTIDSHPGGPTTVIVAMPLSPRPEIPA